VVTGKRGEREEMQVLIDLLKIVAALAVIAALGSYWFTHGLPPRGKGRWRDVLSERRDRRR
jgi:hypothetical protein